MILYSYYRSSPSWRVRIVLAVKGLPYEYRAINLIKRDQSASTYLEEVNPMGQVPTLQVDGHSLSQSVSIFEYLEESYPDKPLLPKDLFKRAKVREIAELIAGGIQPLQSWALLQRLPEDQHTTFVHDTINRGFPALEALLSKSSGKYCVGDDLSWADCCLLPQIFNAKLFGVDMHPYPIITRIGAALEELPPFQVSHPFLQPDCPEELKQK